MRQVFKRYRHRNGVLLLVTSIPDPKDVDLVLYHASCQDGFTAAWAAWKRLGDQAEYVSVQYGDDPPDTTGRNVAIVDFSFKRKVQEEIAKKAKSMVVLDHHKTAKHDLGRSYRPFLSFGDDEFDLTNGDDRKAVTDRLAEIGKEATGAETGFLPAGQIELRRFDPLPYAIFDMEKAGCLLTWEWFHPDQEPPDIVRYANDRDLWKFKLQNTNLVTAALSLVDFDFNAWDETASALETEDGLKEILTTGSIVRKHIEKIAKRKAKHAVLIELCDHRMWAVNYAGSYTSDVAQALRQKTAEDGTVPGMALVWFFDEKKMVFRCSLRSVPERGDVSKIATTMHPEGGGHRNAAGFEFDGDIRDLIKPVFST